MAVLSLPLTFSNSFWSQDYRRGLEVLFAKLEQGVAENDEISAFVKVRATAESNIANSLANPLTLGKQGTGFSADEGASLFTAFRGLQAESAAQGKIHNNIAKELRSLVADPFDEWAQSYKERLRQNKATVIDNWLRSYEQGQNEVAKLKQHYLAKVRRADEAEDDARFAPTGNGVSDKFTNSPRIRPVDSHRAPPQRTASVSERIAQRLKEIQKKSGDVLSQSAISEDQSSSPESMEEIVLPKVDKGKGKEILNNEPDSVVSPRPMSPMPPPKDSLDLISPQFILLSGLALTPSAVSQLLTRAAAELPLRPVRFPLLGEYQDAFTGEEFVSWLQEHVPSFDGSLDRAEEVAKDLAERDGLLRRLGELGNQFENSDDAFYQFRPKAFDLEKFNTDSALLSKTQPENLLKKTGTFVSLVSKALNNSNTEPAYIRARHDADEADKAYRIAVRKLDRQRLALEERIEETLKILQRWESERLRAVKTVLLQYQGTLANLPKSLEFSNEQSATLIASYQPEADVMALIERYRTGPFRPDAQLYESVAHDESDVVFGIDLRKWAEGGWYSLTQGNEKKDVIPPVLTALLGGLDIAYERAPNDIEKRKSWIYEVPLPIVHHLRETLNAVPPQHPYSGELFAKFDAPVIASCIKLWILELNPPITLYEGWEDFRRLYPTVGSGAKAEDSQEEHIELVSAALQRLPRVHLYVLDAIIKHLKTLVESTNVEEDNEVYFTKLALSMGRTILRPKQETQLSIQDRHPTLLFLDLLKNYDALLPPTIARKKRESERKVPIRKRTAPIDMRLSRSRIVVGADAQQLLAAQQIAQNPSLAHRSPELPSLPAPDNTLAQTPHLTVESPHPHPPHHTEDIATKPLTPPPPSVLKSQPDGRPVFKEPPPEFDDLPPKPSFRDPSPELGDLPPRPSFKEPPPELDDLPPRPTFADPPPEVEPEVERPIPPVPGPAASPSPPPRKTSPAIGKVIPPTPQRRGSVQASPSPSKSTSSPPNEDVVLGGGKSTITRSGSGQTAGMRGPRLARGTRGGSSGGGSVQNMVQSLNRSSVGSAPNSAGAVTNPKVNRLSGSPVRRPSSVVGRSSANFSKRTITSDGEDDSGSKK